MADRFQQGASREVLAPCEGYIARIDTERYGTAALLLGAGRNLKEDTIDHAAGIIAHKKKGDRVQCGDRIATLYACDESRFAVSEAMLLSSLSFEAEPPPKKDIVLAVIDEASVKESC